MFLKVTITIDPLLTVNFCNYDCLGGFFSFGTQESTVSLSAEGSALESHNKSRLNLLNFLYQLLKKHATKNLSAMFWLGECDNHFTTQVTPESLFFVFVFFF